MSTLLLRLAAPMQSWGDSSRFATRHTRSAPTKSGVLGLLAAAQGRRRTDPLEDLLSLRFGTRVDQPGQVMSDFHTAIDWRSDKSMPLSNRHYLTDATFLAAVEGDTELVSGLGEAVQAPRFPLYLGRRSCPVVGNVLVGVTDSALDAALASPDEGGTPWLASQWFRRTQPRRVALDVITDAGAGEPTGRQARDVPLSFDPRRREYGWRAIVESHVWVDNPSGHERPDFLAAAGRW